MDLCHRCGIGACSANLIALSDARTVAVYRASTELVAAGSFAAQQVFESNGLNLAYTGERILKPYYHRWLRNPLRIDPVTKMPVYFDNEGKSPLADIYEGDGTKQIEAIWQYIRLGNKMPSPAEAQ